MLTIMKFISLLLGIWFTILNYYFFKNKENIPPINFFIQAISITIFIFIQFNLF